MTTEPTAADRTLDAFRRLVRTVFPGIRYYGRYRYAVHSATATTFDGTPVNADVAPVLPTGVPYAPSLAGSSCIPTQGTIAHVMFADGDPGQPWCVAFENTGASTATAINAPLVTLAGGGAAVARVGDVAGYEYLHVNLTADTVTLYRSAANGAASSWSAVASGALPPVDGVTSGTAITITTGSAKTSSG